MSTLQKATLTQLSPDGTQTVGDPVPVQFNPATMKLQIKNDTEGGQSRGRQTQQFLGSSSTTLTIDLIFDTADEGSTGSPRSVRERTAIVEKYLVPIPQQGGKETPPLLKFQWGPFLLKGKIDGLTIDLDHFAADGTPLRAKVGLALTEQDLKYEAGQIGPGANKQAAPPPGNAPAGLPGSGPGAATQSATALGGETAADFAVRVGLDPTAWRGLDIGGDSSLSLSAGLEVGFSADLSASAGLGVTAGFEAGVSASLNASVGLDVSASVGLSGGAAFSAGVSAGLALTSAGGLSAAIAQVATANAAVAVQQTAQAFQQSVASGRDASAGAASSNGGSNAAIVAGPPAPQLGMPAQSRVPLTQTGLPSRSQRAAAPPAPVPMQIDGRAVSFGLGVPLRSQVGSAALQRMNLTSGGGVLAIQTGSGDPPITSNPTIAPWVALPSLEFAVDASGGAQRKRRPQPVCGCTGSCGCGSHPRSRGR